MSEFLGYISSFFVSFGLGIGFLIGGAIFLFLIVYGFMFFFKRSRRMIREERTRDFPVTAQRRMVPVRNNPKRPTGPVGGATR